MWPFIIDPRHQTVNDETDSSALSAVRKVNVLLAPLLVELYGEVHAVQPANPEQANSSYVVEDFGFHCRIGLSLHNDAAANLTAVIRVGRFYCGYRRALRWLANNRSNNTVSIAFVDQHAKDSELWLACNRITAPSDAAGLREAVSDIHNELGAVDAGLRMWFPQVLRGQMLTNFEEAAADDEYIRSMLASPQSFLDHAHQHPEEEISPQLISEAYGWLGKWNEQLRYVDGVSELAEDRKGFLWTRARPLLELRRYEELSGVCAELELLADESEKPIVAGVLAHALYERGELEDVLDVLRSATLDSAARVCLFRCLAQARLGKGDEATESYLEYDRLVGRDIIAAKMLAQVMPEQV